MNRVKYGLAAASVIIMSCRFSETGIAGTTSNRTVPEQAQFDFWLGNWELTWNDTSHGANTIEAIMDSMVIRENFDGTPDIKLVGESVSSYHRPSGQWKQTWVDNQGGYLDFTGGMTGDDMILSRNAVDGNGKPFMQRMVWREITENSFEWNWQESRDGGRTWNTNWQISYRRKNARGY